MTKDELFTLIALKLGPPRPLIKETRYGGKGLTTETVQIDYACEFVSLAAQQDFICHSERDLRRLYAEYVDWYERQIPKARNDQTNQSVGR